MQWGTLKQAVRTVSSVDVLIPMDEIIATTFPEVGKSRNYVREQAIDESLRRILPDLSSLYFENDYQADMYLFTKYANQSIVNDRDREFFLYLVPFIMNVDANYSFRDQGTWIIDHFEILNPSSVDSFVRGTKPIPWDLALRVWYLKVA